MCITAVKCQPKFSLRKKGNCERIGFNFGFASLKLGESKNNNLFKKSGRSQNSKTIYSMKYIIFIVLVLFLNYSFGQNFNLFYADFGLGSNHGYPSTTEIRIDKQTMILRTTHKVSDSTIREFQTPDTIGDFSTLVYQYVFDFKRSDIDSICLSVDTLKNKKVICSNPFVRSGAMYKLLINYDGNITEFSMTNTYDSTAMKIVSILNSYLPEENQIYYPSELWESNPYKRPLIKSFEEPGEGNSREAYENEFEIFKRK